MSESIDAFTNGLSDTASYEQLTNSELRDEIIRAEKLLDNSPVQMNNFLILQLLVSTMKEFRKVNADPIKGEDKKEHKALLKKYDELIERYNAYLIKIKMDNPSNSSLINL
jgi:hypothetical protein